MTNNVEDSRPDTGLIDPNDVDDVVPWKTDILLDTASGIAGPVLASGMSLIEQLISTKSVEDLKKNRESYETFLNYVPRTDAGKRVNAQVMNTIGDAVTFAGETYTENKDKLGPIPEVIDAGVELYNEIPEEYRFAIGNVATVAEALVPLKGSSAVKGGTYQMPEGLTPDLIGDVPASSVLIKQEIAESSSGVDPNSVTDSLVARVDAMEEHGEVVDDVSEFMLDADEVNYSYEDITAADLIDEEDAMYSGVVTGLESMKDAGIELDEARRGMSFVSSDLDDDVIIPADYLGGIRDGGVVNLSHLYDGESFTVPDKYSQRKHHLRSNKSADMVAIDGMEEFSDFDIEALTVALQRFKRPDPRDLPIEDVVVYVVGKNYADEIFKSQGGEGLYDPDNILSRDELLEVFYEDVDVRGLDVVTEELYETTGSPNSATTMYRAFNPNNEESVAALLKLANTEQARLNKFRIKYRNKPDTVLYQSTKYGDGKTPRRNYVAADTQGVIEDSVKFEGMDTPSAHAELGYGAFSTTNDPNFLTYQRSFKGSNPKNVVFTRVSTPEYRYMQFNMAPATYDELLSHNHTTGESIHTKAQAYERGVTGTADTSVYTRVPRSKHLEGETALAEPHHAVYSALVDDASLLSNYKRAGAATRRYSKEANAMLGSSEVLNKVKKAYGINPNQGYLGQLENIVMNPEWTDYMRKPAYREAVYQTVRSTLREALDSVKYNRGSGSGGDYTKKLKQLGEVGVGDARTHTDMVGLLKALAKSYGDTSPEKVKNLQALLSSLDEIVGVQDNMTAVNVRDRVRKPVDAVRSLTQNFNGGGLVGDEMDSLGMPLDSGLPTRVYSKDDQDFPEVYNKKAVAPTVVIPEEDPNSHGISLEVEAKDTLTSMSRELGIPVATLAEWKGGDPNVLSAGESISVPNNWYSFVEEDAVSEAEPTTPTSDIAEEVTPLTEPVVEPEGIMAPVATTHADNMLDWFASSEGTKTTTVNGVLTYPYGVEEGKFAGVDRELYKKEDGTYKDKEFAKAVLATHIKTLKANHPDWATYPKGVKEALTSYKWNYGLGVSVVTNAKAAAKLTDPTARKAKFKEAMASMLDTFGAKDKAKGDGKKGAMTGLVKRRADDYNRAADDLGYTKIATYSLNNKGTGAEAVYKAADGTVIATETATYKIHTDSKAVTDKAL